MKEQKYIGILVSNRGQQKRILQTYQKFATIKVILFAFIPSSIRWDDKKIIGLHFYDNQYRTKLFSFPEVIYNRYYGVKDELIQRLERVIGTNKCFNHKTRLNKQHIYELLSTTELIQYLPETLPFNEKNFVSFFQKHRMIYLKPMNGSRGKGVYRIEIDDSGKIRISQHHFAPFIITNDMSIFHNKIIKLIGSKQYIAQQGISLMQYNGKTFDIRVLVQKNSSGLWQITNLYSRVAYDGCFNTSVCEKIYSSEEILKTFFPLEKTVDIIKSLSDISLKSAEYIEANGNYHMGEISVDFGIDNNGKLWIIEINGYPQKSIYKDLKNAQDVYKNPIQYAIFLLSEHTEPLHITQEN